MVLVLNAGAIIKRGWYTTTRQNVTFFGPNLYIHFFGNAVCFISYAFIIIITVPDIHGLNVLTFRFYRHVSEQVRVEFTVQTLIA